jgi:hypothetical protein
MRHNVRRLQIHEYTTATGELAPIFLAVEADELSLIDDGTRFTLPAGALEAVMTRYGAPVDPAEPVRRVGSIALPHGGALSHVRHLAGYDVVSRDYLILERAEGEPLCVMATTVAGALGHLARAACSAPPRA